MEASKDLFCSSKFPRARERISSKFVEKIGQAPSKGFSRLFPGTDRPHCTSDGDLVPGLECWTYTSICLSQ